MAIPMKPSSDAAYVLFGAAVLIRRLRALTHLIEGVCRGEDPEFIHKMRVAGRRLRAAMSAFRDLLPPERREWRRAVRQVMRSLGSARDLDVQREFLRRFEEEHRESSLRPALLYLRTDLQNRRREMQDDIRGAVRRLRRDPMLRDLRKHLRRLRRQARHQPVGSAASARRRAREAILRRFRKFLAYEAWVVDPSARRELHEMRIAAKRLRYVLEIFDPLWNGALAPAAERIRGFQRSLGELHDCDVWVDLLSANLEDSCSEGSADHRRNLLPGFQALLADRRQRRTESYETFHREYRAAQTDGFWESLFRTVQGEENAAEEEA